MTDLSTPWAAEALAGEMLDALAVPAWLHRADLPLRGNPALLRLNGMSASALQQTAHLALVADDDRSALAAATDACLHGSGEPPAQPARLRHADGSERPVELTLRRVRLGGQPAALVTCVDQSDVQHVLGMLQGMSSVLRQIVECAPVATFVIDASHCVTHWNSACAELTGWPADQLVGSTEAWRVFYDQPRPTLGDLVVDGADPATLGPLYGDQVLTSTRINGALEAEAFLPALRPEGRWLRFTAAPLRDPAGTVMGAIVTLQDVSQRRRIEEGLMQRLEKMVGERSAARAASARLLDAFIDNAPIGVVYAAGDKILRSNRCMSEIFGLPEGHANGMAARDFHLSDEDLAEIRRVSLPTLSRGLPLHHEMWMRHSSGRPIWVQVNAYVVDANDRHTGAWWMLQDRTEMRAAQQELHARFEQLQATNRQLEQAQNQLLQSEKMASIGQLAAGVAHEINNPIGFVNSNLNTLRQYVDSLLAVVDALEAVVEAPADADAAARLAQTREQAELEYLKDDLPALMDESADGLARVKKIVQDLKDFSRVDQAEWQQADLNAGLESTLNVVRNEVKYKAEVVKQLAPLPLVQCVAGQLNQVFMNLIVNASHAISGHGVITLSTGTEGAWAWVQVQDTGCGMTEEVQRRIFEPFYTTKDVGKGTGLGLSLAFSIVQRHGGAIQVRSAPGQGSAFRVWVPIDGPAAAGGSAGSEIPAWR